MRILSLIACLAITAVSGLPAGGAAAQATANLDVLKGLAPVTILDQSPIGSKALEANYDRTGEIQHGTAQQPLLLPFAEQQQQALRDAFLPFPPSPPSPTNHTNPNENSNASNLADGLGTALGGAYRSATGCTSSDDGNSSRCPNISDNVAQLMNFAYSTTSCDASFAKFFFANETTPDSQHRPVSDEEKAILTDIGGRPDIFGRAYHHPAPMPGADQYGNPRPFETEPDVISFTGKDYFDVPSSSLGYLWGGTQPLANSPSFPSGHTTYGYTEALLLAFMVPQRYPQMIARAAEYGNDRIVIGAHYAMDVIGGRTLALYDLAHLFAAPAASGPNCGGVTVIDFSRVVDAARADVVKELEKRCGANIAVCAQRDASRFADPAQTLAFYESTQTYDLSTVYRSTAGNTEDVDKLAPEAGYLLTTAFPYLTVKRANEILTATEGPGGGFLDNGSAFGVYSRLDLYRAAEEAIKAAPPVKDQH
jgi:hypothetical protein